VFRKKVANFNELRVPITEAVAHMTPSDAGKHLTRIRATLERLAGHKCCSYRHILNCSLKHRKLSLDIYCMLCFMFVCNSMNTLWPFCMIYRLLQLIRKYER
jgi:hypothetical protein